MKLSAEHREQLLKLGLDPENPAVEAFLQKLVKEHEDLLVQASIEHFMAPSLSPEDCISIAYRKLHPERPLV